MKTLLKVPGRKRTLVAGRLAAFSLFAMTSLAQTPAARITTEISDSQRVAIPGTHSPRARAENDTGRVPSGNKLEGINIIFSRSAAQEAALQALIAAQQDPASPLYHKWLTPDEFAARFGVADSDIAKVESWLERQGFSVDGVSRSRNHITFSGTVGQVEAAFGAELHYYQVNSETHFAPSGDISVPAALSSLVQTVGNLSSFRPKPRVRFGVPQPDFTSSQSGYHFLTPKDIATIYDISAAYTTGYNGTGQSIAVVGQSAIVLSDIEHFQSALGFNVKDPTQVLVPLSGNSTIVSGDEAESDLDLEYAGGIAPGATIYFVYVGSNKNYSVFDSISYAVNHQTAPVISDSYGLCETALSSGEYSSLNSMLAQAATQGQSVIGPSGDDGSTDCYGQSGLTTAQQQALAVDFPASSQYVTGMGGTEFPAADVAVGNTTYWAPASGSDVISSALSYIPEQVWNDDDSTLGLFAGGGGVSALTPRPSWQTGVTGIPAGSFRLVPDISLDSSPNNAGYLYCSSDSSLKITGSCTNGFRDSSNVSLTVAGGTSFAVPIFAGMVAIINQKLNSTGQGVVNSTLYTLAANSTTYASAFHDITSGGNQCTAGSTFCSATSGSETNYLATTGYDEASGLGSIDFCNLLGALTTTTGCPSFTVQGSAAVATAGGGGISTITLTPSGGFTGQVAVTCPAATLPPGVTCSPNPLNINVTSSSQATGQLALNVAAPSQQPATAELLPPTRTQYASLQGPPASSKGWWKLSAGSGLAAIFLFFLPGRRYRATLGLWLICVLSFAMGCGGSSGSGGTVAAATTTKITAPVTKAPSGTALSFNVAVTASGTPAGNGMVQLLDGGNVVATVAAVNGVAAFNNITSLSVGTHQMISAHYVGDASTQPSTSGTVSVTVTGNTTVGISTNPASSNSNATISLTIN